MRGSNLKEAENNFLDFVTNEKLINSGDKIIVAVSGGIDSTVLLNLLASFKEKLGIAEIIICHLNHMLRGEESEGRSVC